MPLRFKTGSVKLISGVQGMGVRKNIAQLIALIDYFDVPLITSWSEQTSTAAMTQKGALLMSEIISYSQVEEKILNIRGQSILLDSSVAELYGVETKRVNEAVSNNPDKLPEGYIIALSPEEWSTLRSKISTLDTQGKGRHTKYPPKAFTEKGLYMLATILKSPKATQTTIAIVETFAKMRELSRTIAQLSTSEETNQQKALMQKSGEILANVLEDDFEISGDETTIEVNFAIMKIKHTIKRSKRKK